MELCLKPSFRSLSCSFHFASKQKRTGSADPSLSLECHKETSFFMTGWLAFQFNPDGRYSRYKNQRLHRMGAVYLFVFPQHHFAALARFIHIDNALIRRTPETQGDVIQAVDIGAIHQHVNQA